MPTTLRKLLAPMLLATVVGRAHAQPSGPEAKLKAQAREVAGSAEFLRGVPKHFATLQAVDPLRREVTLLIEGDVLAKVWPLVPDAEIKVLGWWGRLEHLSVGDRVWVWLKTDRKGRPVAVSMLADEVSQQNIHGPGVKVQSWDGKKLVIEPAPGPRRTLAAQAGASLPANLQSGQRVYVQSAGKQARLVLDAKAFQAAQTQQKERLRACWIKEGLPGTAAFVHVFSGEMDLLLDHEAMRWGRSLQVGDAVTLAADPPIKALVKHTRPWRERTLVRLVVHSRDLADLAAGQRLHLRRTPPPAEVDTAPLPPDVDRPRSKAERVEWFLASIYCTCKVAGNVCTGHFYTLASCNPNGCGMPNAMRQTLRRRIDAGLTDRQIFEELLKQHGPDLVRPHLLP